MHCTYLNSLFVGKNKIHEQISLNKPMLHFTIYAELAGNKGIFVCSPEGDLFITKLLLNTLFQIRTSN